MFCNECGTVMTINDSVKGEYYCENCGAEYFDEEEAINYRDEVKLWGYIMIKIILKMQIDYEAKRSIEWKWN